MGEFVDEHHSPLTTSVPRLQPDPARSPQSAMAARELRPNSVNHVRGDLDSRRNHSEPKPPDFSTFETER